MIDSLSASILPPPVMIESENLESKESFPCNSNCSLILLITLLETSALVAEAILALGTFFLATLAWMKLLMSSLNVASSASWSGSTKYC